MRARIIKMEGIFGRDASKDFEKFELKIGDEIEVNPFVSFAVSYQPEKGGDVLFIYTWNIEKLTPPTELKNR